MIFCSPRIFSCVLAGLTAVCFTAAVSAQTLEQRSESAKVAAVALPDAPQPDQAPAPAPAQQPSSTPPASSASSASTGAAQNAPPALPQSTDKTREALAEEQLKQQQTQRLMGVIPNFNTSYVYGAASLTSGQKFRLALRSATDPVQFLGVTPFVALIGQANADHYGYGGGLTGYAKRYGQTFADNFDGTILGNALFPSIFRQDPRYFRLGRGSTKRRLLYALGTNVLTRHDVTGRWEPNYSNVLGNLASGGISNLYLPKDERGFGSTISGGLTVTAEGGIGSLFQEFWPDISRHFFHKDPTNGMDAINRMKPDPSGGGNPFSNRNK
jgi:hypothetical protein